MSIEIPGASDLYRRLKELRPTAGAPPVAKTRLVSRRPDAPFAESFRLLALNLRVMLQEGANRGLVVFSAYPRDGRSFVAANLAIALAEQKAHVLLVDNGATDKGSVAELLVTAEDSSKDLLPASLRRVAHSTEQPGVWLMNGERGHTNGYPGDLENTAQEAFGAGMFTIVDSAPALTSSRAFTVAKEVGQVLYVVRRRVQDMSAHRQLRDQLRRLDVKILGVVVNEG